MVGGFGGLGDILLCFGGGGAWETPSGELGTHLTGGGGRGAAAGRSTDAYGEVRAAEKREQLPAVFNMRI